MFDYKEYEQIVRDVERVFPSAYAVVDGDGTFVVWPLQGNPVIAKGRTPKAAWKKAHKLIAGKNKKALEKLKGKIKKSVELEEGPFV